MSKQQQQIGGKKLFNLDELQTDRIEARKQSGRDGANKRWAKYRAEKRQQEQELLTKPRISNDGNDSRNEVLEEIVDRICGLEWNEQETVIIFQIIRMLRGLRE